jgi:hypothetical protein
LEDPFIDGRIILQRIYERLDGEHGSGQGHVAGSCRYGDDPSSSITSGEFLD